MAKPWESTRERTLAPKKQHKKTSKETVVVQVVSDELDPEIGEWIKGIRVFLSRIDNVEYRRIVTRYATND